APIGKFVEQDSDIADHGQKHLAEVLSLLFMSGGELDLGNLGDAIDNLIDLVAELFPQLLGRDECVFENVMKQTCGDGCCIKPELGQNVSHFKRMSQVRLAVHPA